jgi:hypothetical protein
MMMLLKRLFRKQMALAQDPPNIQPSYIVGMQGKFCSLCGAPEVVEHRVREDFCGRCWQLLVSLLDARKAYSEKHGPNFAPRTTTEYDLFSSRFLAIYFTGNTTLGFSLMLVDTPRGAMAYAMRVAERNCWKLLRVDSQDTLTDIFRDEDYIKYFPASQKEAALKYDAERYGAIPVLWAA